MGKFAFGDSGWDWVFSVEHRDFRGIDQLSDIVAPDPFVPLDYIRNTLIYDAGPGSFFKIYCKCGRIVDVDRSGCELKKKLKKEIECSCCRNERISRELDLLDEHFCPIEIEEEF